jgi:hypothetical protein
MNKFRNLLIAALSFAVLSFQQSSRADEGMWLYTAPPLDRLAAKHGFKPTPEWLEHLQKSSARFGSGGSGSFVSEDGLLLSNHHVGAGAIQRLSTKERNLYRDGFYAKTMAQELPCQNLEVNVLQKITDVTAKVNAAVKPDMSAADAFAARRSIISQIEKEATDSSGLRSDVTTLFQGAEFHLYQYKRYTELNLVFAPELQMAFFGGDPDNFEYPRYDLDFCLFRAYENGKPVKVQHYFHWAEKGVQEKDLVFVSGHPGRTSRLLTLPELYFLRDFALANRLTRLYRLEVLANAYVQRSDENLQEGRQYLFGVQNSRKALDGKLKGLFDPETISKKQKDEQDLLSRANPAQKKEYAEALQEIQEAIAITKSNSFMYGLLEEGTAFNTAFYTYAKTLLRSSEEFKKPNGSRLREYTDSGKTSLELALFSSEPVHPRFEEVRLADSLRYFEEELGLNHPVVRKIMAGKSPSARAHELISQTKLKDASLRKSLYQSGKTLTGSEDVLIALAHEVDADARKYREVLEIQNERKEQAHTRIVRKRNEVLGLHAYPDATFTLRLAYGTVSGYQESGQTIPPLTTFAGMYQHSVDHHGKEPFDLPTKWLKAKSKLKLNTPLNFISDADIIGGNSGSPVLNRDGELVGLIFDGNIDSLVLDYVYTDTTARSLSVDTRAIVEALKSVYGAGNIAKELTSGHIVK